MLMITPYAKQKVPGPYVSGLVKSMKHLRKTLFQFSMISFRSGFLGVYAQKWDCWVTWKFYLGRWERGSGWGTHVNPLLFHSNV